MFVYLGPQLGTGSPLALRMRWALFSTWVSWWSVWLRPAECEVIYTSADESGVENSFNISWCDEWGGEPGGTPAQIDCQNNEPILAPFPSMLYGVMREFNTNFGATKNKVCALHRGMCKVVGEYYADASCTAVTRNCRRALRHLDAMLFNSDPSQQECNNFALKSIRGFFHDHMSAGIEGSILHENHVEMNVGLCRWTQYVNVLSDETLCDPGTIIAMAGQLGFKACGLDVWEVDYDTRPFVTANRGYPCSAIVNPKLSDSETGQRMEKFSDMQVASNSTAMEEVKAHEHTNTHTHTHKPMHIHTRTHTHKPLHTLETPSIYTT